MLGWGAWPGRHERAAGDSGVLRGALQVLQRGSLPERVSTFQNLFTSISNVQRQNHEIDIKQYWGHP